ncbi:SGNH/GDSL hydrolase family protein [Pedobacter heparinus]|uniref:Putative lipase n=1 Tax=Pedobacter heparinus (strain ATCC 13125 / DSM 2366 / CIP 104194 / JCM 7457 / NBRC 12017 / NCIMB 9290 / NRRL B-14731 / HIM 762-3) TaxID=485917 RepID=C6XV53_PEDHD|nr:SGNH/GDSL hydrolase family protein [Pedobacter heparinus]ACU06061.1 putative lipase [Pedobacter heparinus DSM 2366]
MNRPHLFVFLFFLTGFFVQHAAAQQIAAPDTYLSALKAELEKKWPENHTINLVFHGHSVPTGYFATPDVNTLDAYPHALLAKLKQKYPFAVINVITTSIGGENSEQGQKRLKNEVLVHRPDVLFIDYALNDRGIGLERSKIATERMIRAALSKGIKVILLTPSPDISTNILQEDNPLQQHTEQLITLAKKYHIGLSDSFGEFKALAKNGQNLKDYMAQSNHPNKKGHQIIADELFCYFK